MSRCQVTTWMERVFTLVQAATTTLMRANAGIYKAYHCAGDTKTKKSVE
jgi:hypothetical protein